MSDIVKLYNPANAGSLTPEQVEGLQKLTSAEIKALAQAYPNAVMQKAYLLIIDNKKEVHKQLPALSSFENLYNLREKNGQRQFVAFSFRAGYKPPQRSVQPIKVKKTEVLDLSNIELMHLPGFKTSTEKLPDEIVEVKKIKKVKKADKPDIEVNP